MLGFMLASRPGSKVIVIVIVIECRQRNLRLTVYRHVVVIYFRPVFFGTLLFYLSNYAAKMCSFSLPAFFARLNCLFLACL